MAEKTSPNRNAAQQVFRQFAWNIAGTLAKAGSTKKPSVRRAGAKRAAAK